MGREEENDREEKGATVQRGGEETRKLQETRKSLAVSLALTGAAWRKCAQNFRVETSEASPGLKPRHCTEHREPRCDQDFRLLPFVHVWRWHLVKQLACVSAKQPMPFSSLTLPWSPLKETRSLGASRLLLNKHHLFPGEFWQ